MNRRIAAGLCFLSPNTNHSSPESRLASAAAEWPAMSTDEKRSFFRRRALGTNASRAGGDPNAWALPRAAGAESGRNSLTTGCRPLACLRAEV